MPIKTDLSVSPYYDDFKEDKSYYKVLFKPSVAVQVRELNQLQSILQSQVEKFGDSVFKRGTIIDGCNFTFSPDLRYVRIRDNQVDGAPVNVSSFKDLVVKDSDDLTAYVVETSSGFESQAPDLNTLYVNYINSGTNYEKSQFVKNTILTVYDADYPITKAVVNEGASGFSNTDTLVVYPAIAVQNSSGGATFPANTWVLNTRVIQDTTGAEAEILEVNATANALVTIIRLRPLETDLDDNPFDANNWLIESGYSITGGNLGATTANSSANGVVVGIVGSGAAGTLLTDSTGKITQVAISSGGTGYYVAPHVTVASPTGAIESANIQGYNYLAQVTVQNDDAAAGNSYGVSVSDGVIYQKGYFSRVNSQLVVVEKYANTTTPDLKVVGFDTLEELISSDDDETLLDNAIGTYNYTAPGADRLKLTPTLVVLDKTEATANSDFLPLIEFSKGKPFKQTRNTQFNKIAAELAQRTFEESGNYVIDQFNSATSSPADTSEANTFNVVVDPGIAYIKGYRVESVQEYTETLDKGVDTNSLSSLKVDINYGSYIRITDVGGYFQFNTGEVISLRDTAADYTANSDNVGTVLAAPGSEIGKARMRSMVYESGEPGSTAVYRLYLFDIAMNTAKNFADVRSVYYDGTDKGYGDLVLEASPTGGSLAKVYETDKTSLIFPTGYSAVQNVTSLTYKYRSVNATATVTTGGLVNAAPVTGTWTYSGELTTAELSEIIATPLANLETANVGTVSVGAGANTGNTTIVFSNATFGAAVRAGDFIRVYNTSSDVVRKIVGISNSTHATIDKGTGFTNASSNVAFICPAYVPLQLSTRTDRSANVNGSYLRIYINPPANFTSSETVAVAYNAQRSSVAPTTKNTFRNRFVKLQLANNVTTTTGPWYLGVPDIFRLKKVYLANTSTVNTNSTDVTANFFIDHNQTENYYDNGYLFKKPNTSLSLSSGDFLLVQYDAFNKSGGVYTASSYNRDDEQNLSGLNSSSANVHTVEIPEMYTSRGEYFDLRDSIDFRISANTISNTAVTSATDGNMTLNPGIPAYADKIDDTVEQYFPVPQSDVSFNLSHYLGRADRLVMTANGDFVVLTGESGKDAIPKEPSDSLTVNIINIPAYPSLPEFLSANTIELLDTGVANIRYTNKRRKDYTITQGYDRNNIVYEQNFAYKMSDIASIDRRLKNVEYRIDLKDIEDTVKDQSIPSSVDATLERFKLGFFVDNFTSVDYSDIDDPEYSAMNFNYRMTSMKKQINVKYKFNTANDSIEPYTTGGIATLPYEEYIAVSQPFATAAATAANTVVQQQKFIYEYVTSSTVANLFYAKKTRYEPDTQFKFSENSGPAVLYIFPWGIDRYEVYQSTEPGFTPSAATLLITSESAVNKTTDENNALLAARAIISRKGYKKTSVTNPLQFRKSGSNPKFWAIGTGKITWTHDPARGQYYIVRVRKGTGWNGWRLEYPTDADFPELKLTGRRTPVFKGRIIPSVKTITNTVKIHSVLGPYGYISITEGAGSALTLNNKAAAKGTLSISGLKQQGVKINKNTKFKLSDTAAGPFVVKFTVSGLRPLSKHNIYLDTNISNSKAKALSGPFAGRFGSADADGASTLISDEFGNLSGELYIDNGIPDTLTETDYSQLAAIARGSRKKRRIWIGTSDGLSRAAVLLSQKLTLTEDAYIAPATKTP